MSQLGREGVLSFPDRLGSSRLRHPVSSPASRTIPGEERRGLHPSPVGPSARIPEYPTTAGPHAAYHSRMGIREERVARNEAGAREINEEIEGSYASHALDTHLSIVCECGRDECDVFLSVTKSEYEYVRSDPRWFLISRLHLIPDVEDVVSEHDRYTVVAKREGEAAEVAIQTDPRA